MADEKKTSYDEVDQLMRNAQLRDELEPFFDEAIGRVNVREFSTVKENEFLASMLAWERAPVVPIGEWFEPPLVLPHPDEFANDEDGEAALHQLLWETIYKLYDKRIVLDFTDHLSDRQLYCLVFRDILPSQEKKLEVADSYLHWDCCDGANDPETWLRFYASDKERHDWAEETDQQLPPRQPLPYPRRLPRRSL
ncbi:MAG: hypothetical protein OES79_02640 [Planctomycetota bacterium]|nr:hypothetical protein [Planctomycetota bacterium]